MSESLLRLWGRLPLPGWLRWWLVFAGVPKFPAAVIAAVLDGQGRLLLFRHPYRGRYPWGLPSGWLEPGEQPDAAIAREIYEETRLEVEQPTLVLVHNARDARRLDLVFKTRLAGGKFQPSAEVAEMGWFDRDGLPDMMESQVEMIRTIYRLLDERRYSRSPDTE